jgi:zinc/manganese transport system ATP-binding protein
LDYARSWCQIDPGGDSFKPDLARFSMDDTRDVDLRAMLTIEDLTLAYDRTPAVRNLSAMIEEQSLTAIVGPNGAGKSTLLKGVMGLLRPQNGRIDRGPTADQIAYLPQQSDVDRRFPIGVFDLVAMGLWSEIGAFGGLTTRQRTHVHDAIAAVGLTGFEDRSIGTLSGGQMQRALFARLLLQDASLVLLDEPFTAIDARTAADLIAVVKGWHGEGRTVLAVLHDLETVHAHFPRALLLARDLVAHGETAHVLTAEKLLHARKMCEACADEEHSCGREKRCAA